MKEYIVDKFNNKMRYHDFPGEDTPILFIHGLGCSGSFDYPEVAAQTDLVNHRRILIDLLGSGFSDKPDDDKSELEKQGINIEIVKEAGHSMAWENPKGLAEAISKGILYSRKNK